MYASGIEYLLNAKLLKSELAKTFKQDYEAQKSTTTFWVAYGITKKKPTIIIADISSIIGGHLKCGDILHTSKKLSNNLG